MSRHKHFATSVDYWADLLSGAPAESRFPCVKIDGEPGGGRGRVDYSMTDELRRDCVGMAEKFGVTVFDVLLASIHFLLSRQAAQPDVCVMVTVPDLVPTRARLDANVTFSAHLASVGRQSEAAIRYPLSTAEILRAASAGRDHQTNPCRVLLSFVQGRPTSVLSGQQDTSVFDVAFYLVDVAGDVRGWIDYAVDRYDEEAMVRLGGRFDSVLTDACAQPNQPISQFEILAPGEREQIAAWQGAAGPTGDGLLVGDLVYAAVLASPESEAVVASNGGISYRQLWSLSGEVAARLNAIGIGAGTVVGICSFRSIEMMVALLAILRSGAAYCPLDHEFPVSRLEQIIDEAGIRVILADAALASLFKTAGGRQIIGLDAAGAKPVSMSQPRRAEPDDPAYVMFTSGSTGVPKGVVVAHRGVVNRLLWMQRNYTLGPSDTALQKTPITFDISVCESFWPLIAGARLFMVEPDGHKDPDYLADIIESKHVTVVHFVPSMLAVFLEYMASGRCAGLKRVICGGEALPAAVMRNAMAALPNTAISNMYGPTEATIEATAWDCSFLPEGVPVPIGRPIDNVYIQILDEFGHVVPIGTPGELHIGGIQVAKGYIGRPDLTAERFITDPTGTTPDLRLYKTGDLARWTPLGLIEYLGRTDHQVKLHGLRIELGEIESAARRSGLVRDVVVVLRQDPELGPQLVAYAIADPETFDVNLLRHHLRSELPAYMVPSRFMVLPAFPLSSNGKLNRKALPPPHGPLDAGDGHSRSSMEGS